MRREDEKVCAMSTVVASAAKQSGLPSWRDSGLLRCARNDGVDISPNTSSRTYETSLASFSAVIVRAGGRSSTPRLIDSSTTASGILDPRLRGHDSGGHRTIRRTSASHRQRRRVLHLAQRKARLDRSDAVEPGQ